MSVKKSGVYHLRKRCAGKFRGLCDTKATPRCAVRLTVRGVQSRVGKWTIFARLLRYAFVHLQYSATAEFAVSVLFSPLGLASVAVAGDSVALVWAEVSVWVEERASAEEQASVEERVLAVAKAWVLKVGHHSDSLVLVVAWALAPALCRVLKVSLRHSDSLVLVVAWALAPALCRVLKVGHHSDSPVLVVAWALAPALCRVLKVGHHSDSLVLVVAWALAPALCQVLKVDHRPAFPVFGVPGFEGRPPPGFPGFGGGVGLGVGFGAGVGRGLFGGGLCPGGFDGEYGGRCAGGRC